MTDIKQHVTVVPSDNLIIVDGETLRFNFAAPSDLHALQWHGEQGHREWTSRPGTPFTVTGYAEIVQPYVTLWQAEKLRRDQVAAAEQALAEAAYNSETARAGRLRAERDRRIAACDFLMVADYPMSEVEREPWRVYRQALRDLPEQPGFPWDGGGEATPWPAEPAVTV